MTPDNAGEFYGRFAADMINGRIEHLNAFLFAHSTLHHSVLGLVELELHLKMLDYTALSNTVSQKLGGLVVLRVSVVFNM